MNNGKAATRSLGILNTSGKSLRETIDREVQKLTKGYRTGKLATSNLLAAAAGRHSGQHEARAGRAVALRSYIDGLAKVK
jgi:hypothetical protein